VSRILKSPAHTLPPAEQGFGVFAIALLTWIKAMSKPFLSVHEAADKSRRKSRRHNDDTID